jgi:MSHA biogenesis protein MshQ
MSSIAMGNYLKQLNACETQITPTGNVAMVSGKLPGAGLVLTKPGLNNSGSVDLAVNVGSAATGNTCVAAVQSPATAANLPWFGPNPGARATFGIYKSEPLIYRRENY